MQEHPKTSAADQILIEQLMSTPEMVPMNETEISRQPTQPELPAIQLEQPHPLSKLRKNELIPFTLYVARFMLLGQQDQ